MTLQSALAAVLLVGLPLVLLALGVLAHAYYVARPRNAARADRLIEELVAESVDQLIEQLRATTATTTTAGHRSMAAPPALVPAHAFSALPAPALVMAPAPSPAPSMVPVPNVRGAMTQLLAEGLSDRSIARRLGVGIEEVRAARLAGSRRSAA
jgi:hypothetical protein